MLMDTPRLRYTRPRHQVALNWFRLHHLIIMFHSLRPTPTFNRRVFVHKVLVRIQLIVRLPVKISLRKQTKQHTVTKDLTYNSYLRISCLVSSQPSIHLVAYSHQKTDLSNAQAKIDALALFIRLIQSQLILCEELLKETTAHDVVHERFADQSRVFALELKSAADDLHQACTNQLAEIMDRRQSMVILEPSADGNISRDPSRMPYFSTHQFNDKDDWFLVDSPSNRELTDQELRFLVVKGPEQPKLEYYPTNEKHFKNGDTSRFTYRWFEQYPWLEYSRKADKAFCFPCHLFYKGTTSLTLRHLFSLLLSLFQDRVLRNASLHGAGTVSTDGTR